MTDLIKVERSVRGYEYKGMDGAYHRGCFSDMGGVDEMTDKEFQGQRV